MNTHDIIRLIIILIGVSILIGGFRPLHYRHRRRIFLEAYQKTETYINVASRTNTFAGRRAYDMIENIALSADSKWRRRHVQQLHILWKSKFSETFK